jgi:hypothetical protein
VAVTGLAHIERHSSKISRTATSTVPQTWTVGNAVARQQASYTIWQSILYLGLSIYTHSLCKAASWRPKRLASNA